MPYPSQSSNAQIVSPWYGRASFVSTVTPGTQVNLANFSSNAPYSGTSGISVDSNGLFTFSNAGTYVAHITAKHTIGSITATLRGSIVSASQTNASWIAEDSTGYVGIVTNDNNTGIGTVYAGTGLITISAPNGQIKFAFYANAGNVVNLAFSAAFTIYYLGP